MRAADYDRYFRLNESAALGEGAFDGPYFFWQWIRSGQDEINRFEIAISLVSFLGGFTQGTMKMLLESQNLE